MFGMLFLLVLAVPVHSSPAGIPETVLNEILLQKGEDVIIEKVEGRIRLLPMDRHAPLERRLRGDERKETSSRHLRNKPRETPQPR